jgi:DNA (cytosine-5)-methyltransferase 1
MSEESSETAERPTPAGKTDEREAYREFLLRHTDFLVRVLTGEQKQRTWTSPIGCPCASPSTLARRRGKTDGGFSCCYTTTERAETAPGEEECICGDPLCGSDDPLDAVAAVIIASEGETPNRYFTRQARQVIAALREEFGSWTEIREHEPEELVKLSRATDGGRVLHEGDTRRLQEALSAIKEHRYSSGVSLTELSSVAYHRLQGMLASLPGVGERDAWWLLLTALDKPVWPGDERIDHLLVELGLLSSDEVGEERNQALEEALTARQIPPFHRALAGHARYCGGSHENTDCELCQFTLSHRLYKQATVEIEDRPTVVDLFSGAGGLSHGFTRGVSAVSFDVGMAVDQNEAATDTYRLNHPEVPHSRVRREDIGVLANRLSTLDEAPNEVDVVVGGPPCQALSVAGYRSRLASDESYSVIEDPRTELYRDYVTILGELEPRYLIMENVEGILSPLGEDDRRVIDDVETALSNIGYETGYELLDCSEFGVPQNRDRVILFGARREDTPDPAARVEEFFADLDRQRTEQAVTIQQALSNLPRLRRGEGGDVIAGRQPGRASHYVSQNRLGSGTRLTYNHKAREHPMEKDQQLFSEVMEPGDTGWDVKYGTEYGHLIEYNVGTEDNPAFKDKYRMLNWDQPSPTIVAHLAKDGNNFILPDYYKYAQLDSEKQDSRRSRGITPREAARLQSFPDSYVFLGPFTSQFRQIGNAVPPKLGEVIASVLGEYLVPAPAQATDGQQVVAGSDD